MNSSQHKGIEVESLNRQYKHRGKIARAALTDVTFSVRSGEILGILGPNGAGKTTLARILSTLLVPTSGTVRVAGFNVLTHPREVQRRCGVSFGGDLGLYLRLSARDNLRYFAAMYRLNRRQTKTRIPELLQRVGLSDRADDRVEQFSRGMRQRLHIARALIHNPDVIILDEPSAGIDPQGARELRMLANDIARDGHTVLLTTHDLLEAEELCHSVAILNKGKIVRTASPFVLREEVGKTLGMCIDLVDPSRYPDKILNQIPGITKWSRHADSVRVYTQSTGEAVTFLIDHADGVEDGIRISQPSLEDAYLEVVTNK